MTNENDKKISLDILKHLEDISGSINEAMSSRTKTAFQRYPLTFGLLILLGVIVLHEGMKGLLYDLGILELNPWYLIIAGLAVLAITGKLYKKLDK